MFDLVLTGRSTAGVVRSASLGVHHRQRWYGQDMRLEIAVQSQSKLEDETRGGGFEPESSHK